jgi:hypothetical protein
MATQTEFGVFIAAMTTPDIYQLAKDLGTPFMRDTVVLQNFEGVDKSLDKMIASGVDISVTVNWGDQNTGIIPFPTDLQEYKTRLRSFYNAYSSNSQIKMYVCENEPFNDKYHSGTAEQYIAELKAFVNVSKTKGLNCISSGALSVQAVNAISQGKTMGLAQRSLDFNKAMLDALRTVNVDYVDFHTQGNGTSYPAKMIPNVATYVRNYTGKDTMVSDEWHLQNLASDSVGDIMMQQMIEQFKQGGFLYSMYISGTQQNVEGRLNDVNSMNLTHLGKTFKEYVPVPYQNPDALRLCEIWDTTQEGIKLIAKIDPSVDKQCTDVLYAGQAIVDNTDIYIMSEQLISLISSILKNKKND